MVSLEDYNNKYPQNENQLGIEKIEEFCKFKVIYLLRNQIINKNLKITKLFGKSYFSWSKIWNEIKNETIKNLNNNYSKINNDEVNYFLDYYYNSIFNSGNNTIVIIIIILLSSLL